MERRLAAVVAADVVGYSRMIRSNEERTLSALRSLRDDVIDRRIDMHRGRIVKEMGDGLLVEFSSAVNAVSFSVDLQNAMTAQNRGHDPDQQFRFRIGINLGDVVIDGDDIHGDGINVAARLEGLAEPNGVCIAHNVFEQVRDRLDIPFHDLGEKSLKNIDRPVQVWGWTAGDADSFDTVENARVPVSLPSKPSIAVLPFDNLSGDPDQEYFADGMVEDIITGLARLNWLFVIARNSSFTYKGKPIDVKKAGRELGVRYILEGSVRRAASRVRVTAQLIDAENDRHIWAERFDRTLDDVFALQDELTMTVVAILEPNLRQAEIERVKRKRPGDLDAYDLVLRAMPLVYAAMPDGAAEALPLLEQAIEREPSYAQAHGFAAWCHEIMFARGGGKPKNQAGAEHHAQQAIAHGQDDAIALSLGGFVMGAVAHDRAAARQAFVAALALSPSCALAYNLGSAILSLAGEAELAIEWGERALRLSPTDPANYAPWMSIALGKFQQGEYDAAAEAAQKTFQFNPYWATSHFLLAATHAQLGRLDAARRSARRLLDLQPGFTISGLITAFDCHPAIGEPLRRALSKAGLPD